MEIVQGAKFIDWLPPFLPILFRDLTAEDFCRYARKIESEKVVDYEDKFHTRWNCCGKLKAGVTCQRYYCVHYTKTIVANGEDAWRRAKLALSSLEALKTSFSKAKVCGRLEPETPVLISFRFLFFRTIVANKLLYVDDSEGQFSKPVLSPCMQNKFHIMEDSMRTVHRMAVGWGTTRRHLLRGEELVAIEKRKNGDITFEISSFSVASHPLTFLLTPFTQRLQRKFAREASETVKQIINKPS
ncbi:hypothetical protein GpartN1_g6526.t1 [Galdieria partita]|uniref:DUF1990 domain-containing protein n=1 Tax=Galdieria partita TaxID=83374 RepID=A0A9C7Q295_9RHOD|nr:hypothetical protein GpartN1_g6526.t1 [Galdieria partita]